MRTHPVRRSQRGFTLIEILIVVVILGILAAIVIPQFTSASEDAQASSVQSQLQTVRSQIELFQVQNGGYPSLDTAGWTPMIDTSHAENTTNQRYLQSEPRNAMRNNATDIVSGTAGPGAASGGADTDGWYWNTDDNIVYAIDGDGNILEF